LSNSFVLVLVLLLVLVFVLKLEDGIEDEEERD